MKPGKTGFSIVITAIDKIGAEKHQLSGRAKDIGSAAVFVALLYVAFVWLTILVPNFL